MAIVPNASTGSYREEDDRDASARRVFGAIREREVDTRVRLPDDVKADPDAAARARKAAKFTGTSAIAIESNMAEFDQRQRISSVEGAMRESERMRRWFTKDGAARVSHDDVPALKAVAKTYDDADEQGWLPWIGDKIVEGLSSIGTGTGITGDNEARVMSGQMAEDFANADGFLERSRASFQRTLAGLDEGMLNAIAQLTGSPLAREKAVGFNRVASAPIAGFTEWDAVKENPFNVGRYALDQGVASLPYMAAAMTGVGVFAIGTSQSGNIAAERSVNNGGARGDAGAWDFATAAPYGYAAAFLERVGLNTIIAGAGKTATRRIAGAAAGEGLTEFLQGNIEYAGGTVGTEAGFDPLMSLEQGFAGLVAGAPMGAALRGGAEIIDATAVRMTQYAQARTSERLVEDIFNGAAKSKLRLRDPELFAEFMAAQAQGTSAENLYVNGDVLRSLFQDENGLEIQREEGGIDFEEMLPDFWDQLAQADRTGGDVVIPMARAAAYLAGTPEWEIIKGASRVAPGGLSPNEARGLENDWSDTIEEMGRRAYAEARADVEAEGPRTRVYNEVLSQARQAGFSLNASRAYADLWSERYQARAERLGGGTNAWQLFEQSVAGIRQAMPGSVDTYRRGDQMDVLINAMRNSAMPMMPEGEGLIDRIMRGGGVVDVNLETGKGGDIKSMGGDRVRKGGVFGRPLQTLIAQANEAGEFDRSLTLDEWALNLWEEGYFGPREERPTVNELLDLIGDALRGETVVPFDNRSSAVVETNNAIVEAADDLRRVLEDAGLDPETATRQEIDAALDAYQASEAGARGFEQSAFHGSPFTFDRFSTDFMGSGEGVEAFGWGLYFSNAREIAEHYRDVLSRDSSNFTVGDTGDVFDPSSLRHLNARVIARKNGADVAASIRQVRALMDGSSDDMRAMLEEDLAVLGEIEERGGLRPPGEGRLYEVEIPEDNEFLLWDKPLDQQPEGIWDAFVDAADAISDDAGGADLRMMFESGQVTGEEAYKFLAATYAQGSVPDGVGRYTLRQEGAREASEILLAAGVAGVKYQAGQLSDSTPSGAFNYVVFDAGRVEIRSMFQEGARGRIDFLGDGRAMVTLFEGRDMSTLLHEGGHLWLEELRTDALSGRAAGVTQDWKTIKAWMKRETGLTISDKKPIPTEAHELWARAMERYFMEGKAPSAALRSAFASFRAWLVRIYKRVTGLNANIDDEVRQVFARLIATDEAIRFAQSESGDRALFAEAAAAGMTEAEFKAYQDLVSESRTEAYDALLNKTMERVRIERTKEARERRASIRIEVEREIRARPEWQALDLMRGNGGVHMPVSKLSVIERVGRDALELLPRGRPGFPTFTDDGLDADLVAERAGFATGHDMLTALMGIGLRRAELVKAGDRRTVLEEAIDVETDRRMTERYGDILSDGTIEEEALEIIHTDAGSQRLAAEVRQLAKRAGEAPTPEDAIRDWAERIVGDARIVDQASGAAVDRHRRAAEKAGRAAEQAYLNGDFAEAFKQKQRQQIANALFIASRTARDRVEVIGRRLDRYAKSRGYKGMAPEYLDRIHELLEQFDLRKRSEQTLRERETFDKWAARQRDLGIDVQVPERLTLAGDKHFTRLTFDEVVALDDAVESLANLGRQKMRLKLDKEERDLEEMVGQAVQNAVALPTRPFDAERNPSRNFPREINAALVKMEFLADYLDDNDPNGVFNEMLVKGATRAANRLEELQRDVLDPLARLYLDMPGKERRRFAERISVPEFVSVDPETRAVTPTVFMRSELIAVALNVGNKSNMDKMIQGETGALAALLGERGAAPHVWTEEKVMAVLNRHLSESDWQFVETVWQRVNSMWPAIVEAERELTGMTPEKVEARPVETRFGTIEGGYYPLVYDPNRSQIAANNADQEAADMFGAIGRFVGTPKGHTISRTSAALPITFSLERVLFSHIKKVTTRIAYGRYVRDVLKFTGHPKIRKLFDDHLGMEYHTQIKPWLKEQIQDASMDMKHLAALDRILRQFRVNMTLVGLGFRFTTMFAQVAGWHNSQAEIGTKWLLRGVREMARNAGSIRSFVFEKSPEMAGRAQAFDRDIRLFYQQANESGRRRGNSWIDKAAQAADAAGVPKIQAAAFWGIGMIDVYMVAMPTWLGAYHKALDAGMSDAEASAAGDKAVRKSQSAGRSKDLAAVQRGPEGIRVLTTFYSYFNVLYNKQFETTLLVKRGNEAGRRGDKAGKYDHWRQAAMNVWWIMLLAPVTSALLTGDLPDEDERDLEGLTSWAMNRIFFGLWAGVPGLRDVASRAQRKIEGEYAGNVQSPFFTAFDAAERPLNDLFSVLQGDEPSERWIKNAIVAPGYFLGLPTGQLGSTVQYLADVAEGDQNPDDAGDVVKGIVKGPQQNQE